MGSREQEVDEDERRYVERMKDAADPLTPGSRLIELATGDPLLTWTGIARRNPSLPFSMMLQLLEITSIEVWENPSLPLLAMTDGIPPSAAFDLFSLRDRTGWGGQPPQVFKECLQDWWHHHSTVAGIFDALSFACFTKEAWVYSSEHLDLLDAAATSLLWSRLVQPDFREILSVILWCVRSESPAAAIERHPLAFAEHGGLRELERILLALVRGEKPTVNPVHWGRMFAFNLTGLDRGLDVDAIMAALRERWPVCPLMRHFK